MLRGLLALIAPIVAGVALFPATALAATPRCKDDSGRNVDWWAALKAPGGTQYIYADANSKQLRQSNHDMVDKEAGALSATLQQGQPSAPFSWRPSIAIRAIRIRWSGQDGRRLLCQSCELSRCTVSRWRVVVCL